MTHIPTLLQTPETTSHSPFLSYVSCCCGFTPKIWLTGLCGPRIFDHSFSNARFTREGKQLHLVLCVLCTESSCHISRKVGWRMQSLWVMCTRIQEWLSGPEQSLVASSLPAVYLCSVCWCLFPLPCHSRCVEYLAYFPNWSSSLVQDFQCWFQFSPL